MSSGNTIGIEIDVKDIEHLKKFKKSINFSGDVKVYNKKSTFGEQTNARISFSCKRMKNDLIKRNVTSTKSKNGTFPKLDDNKFMRDLLRGMFDGDGCITYKIGKTGKIITVISYCGTYDVCSQIEKISGFNWSWSERFPERKNNNYQISCGRQTDCINFIKTLYDNASIYLERKYILYETICNNRKDIA